MVHSPFAAAFRTGTRFRDDDRGCTLEMQTHAIGELKLPSGRIDLGDPFTTSFDEPVKPLAQVAPIGDFPVEVAVARFADNADQRVACARVRFSPNASAVRWTMALREGQEPPPEDH